MSYLISLIIIIVVALYVLRRKIKGVNCKEDRDMTGEVVVITGSNTGIGLETAKELARRNATIIMGCRDMQKGREAVEQIRQAVEQIKQADKYSGRVELLKLDLSDLTSVKTFAEEVKSRFEYISILINNAGVFGILEKKLTNQGQEMIFGTNYIGHFYLTQHLLSMFKAERQNRILNIVTYIIPNNNIDYTLFNPTPLLPSQNTTTIQYNHIHSYINSKLFLVNHALALNSLHSTTLNLKAVSIHPGVIDTNIVNNLQASSKILNYLLASWVRKIYTYIVKTPIQGAQTTLHCCLQDFYLLKGGKYYQECQAQKVNASQLNLKQAQEVYEFTQNYISKLNI